MNKLIWTGFAVVTWLRWRARKMGDAIAVQTSRLAKPASAFVSQPEPRSYGVAARGVQMTSGNFLVSGRLVSAPEVPVWDIGLEDPEFRDNLHGFAWLDDLAASDLQDARARGRDWLFEWITRYGRSSRQGWRADVVGRRVVRWVNHAILILNQQPPEKSRLYFKSLGHQALFLQKRWQKMRPGLPRFEALTGLVYCGLALEGKSDLLQPALKALCEECDREIAADGSIASRNPEELMEIFTLLSWVSQAADTKAIMNAPEILKALERMAPTLRSVRLGDGGLVRFHGGGVVLSERLDQALADAGFRLPAHPKGAMGYTRLVSGSTQLVMDTDVLPPEGASERAHACTLAFEMSSARLPLIVNRGQSREFSQTVRASTRETPAHNTLAFRKTSSASFDADGFIGRMTGRRVVAGPKLVTVLTDQNETGKAVRATHDGYVISHGMTHFRQIQVLKGGAEVWGEDAVRAETSFDRARFTAIATGKNRKVVPFQVHFHIHPDVSVELDLNGTAASLTMSNGQTWVFRAKDGKTQLRRSSYMERGRLKPRATKQIVVTSRAVNYEGRVTWTLTRSV